MTDEVQNFAKASAKSLKISTQKANLVLQTIRGLKVDNAVNVLEFSRRRIANEIKKILKSAISNAENNHQLDIDKLVVEEATVGKSMVMKRFRPRARGRSGKILKPYSKIRIILKEKEIIKKIDKDTTLGKQKVKTKDVSQGIKTDLKNKKEYVNEGNKVTKSNLVNESKEKNVQKEK